MSLNEDSGWCSRCPTYLNPPAFQYLIKLTVSTECLNRGMYLCVRARRCKMEIHTRVSLHFKKFPYKCLSFASGILDSICSNTKTDYYFSPIIPIDDPFFLQPLTYPSTLHSSATDNPMYHSSHVLHPSPTI